MNDATLTALLAGGAGAVTAAVAAVRGLRSDAFQRRVDERTGLLKEYDQIIAQLRTDMADLRAAHSAEIDRVNRHHRAELENTAFLLDQMQADWQRERQQLREEIETLKAQVVALMSR